MSQKDDIILDEADSRWLAIVETQPDLASAVELQRVLVTRSMELGGDTSLIEPGITAIPEDIFERFKQQQAPVLELAVELNIDRFVPYLLGFCTDFAASGAGEPAKNIRRVLEQAEIEPGSLLHASLLRQQSPIRLRATQLGISPDLIWLIAELTVGPIANRLQYEALVCEDSAKSTIRTAAKNWSQGLCPACGSWPALAESWSGKRHLRCSFCGADWSPPRAQCVYCNNNDKTFLIAVSENQTNWHLEFCRACGGYLKHLYVHTHTPFSLLPVLDLETNSLDIQATERGYGRPPMQERNTTPIPCPPDSVP
ncbi:formate dehydrogenase accessory protein FdhE [bacterium]|nr:MAG: formate dehydrogenase accessory protein FdhE [bacterium]